MSLNYLEEELPEDKNPFNYSAKERKVWLAKKLVGFNESPDIWSKPKIGKKLGISHTQVNRDLLGVVESIVEYYDPEELDADPYLVEWVEKKVDSWGRTNKHINDINYEELDINYKKMYSKDGWAELSDDDRRTQLAGNIGKYLGPDDTTIGEIPYDDLDKEDKNNTTAKEWGNMNDFERTQMLGEKTDAYVSRKTKKNTTQQNREKRRPQTDRKADRDGENSTNDQSDSDSNKADENEILDYDELPPEVQNEREKVTWDALIDSDPETAKRLSEKIREKRKTANTIKYKPLSIFLILFFIMFYP